MKSSATFHTAGNKSLGDKPGNEAILQACWEGRLQDVVSSPAFITCSNPLFVYTANDKSCGELRYNLNIRVGNRLRF